MFTFSPKTILGFLALFCFTALAAQLEVASGPPYTPQNLIETVFLGSGLEVLEVTYGGNLQATGFFDGGQAAVGIERGIILSTGRVKGTFNQVDIEDVGAEFASTDFMGAPSTDPDLLTYLDDPSFTINDAASYTIRFRPFGDSIRFSYVFASEEYPEFVCSNFNDIFGFFISGPGINGPFSNGAENIARIPGTNLPVRINTVNGGQSAGDAPCDLSNSQYYRDNNGSNFQPVFDGLTTVFVAEAAVIPCEEYTMKLIIADVGDGLFDSGVFLQARSFEATGLQVNFTGLSLDNTMAEGCRDATITFTQPQSLDVAQPISYRVFGDAIPGIDYTAIPNDLAVAPGQQQVSYTINAFEDNITEGDEFIYIEVRQNPCRLDTFTIRITENILVPGFLPDTLVVCPGDTVALDANLPVMTPPPPTFVNNTPITIGPNIGSSSSFINVSGVAPGILQPGVIRSVCIDSLTHQWLDDVDIYLLGPNGQILELTTDNGGDGGNNALEDAYIRTCFTPRAVDSIALPGTFTGPEGIPFTGDWQPEGAWDNLYGDFFSTNGNWELRVFDDANGFGGTLWSWSIQFEPIYSIDYSWRPDTSLSCYDCATPLYLGEAVGYFYVEATDVYGCSLQDSIFATYRPTPTLDAVVCEMATDSSLQISWDAVTDALGYEVRIAERTWLPIGNATSHTFQGLVPDSTYSLYVRALFVNCPSPQFNIFCRTTPCIPPSLSALASDLSCFGAADGSLAIEAQGRRAPFTYLLNDESVAAGLINGLSAGSYQLIVQDTVGCRDSLDIALREPDALTTRVQVSQPIRCQGSADAALAAPSSGGTAPYAFSWNTVAGDSLLSGLSPGEYILLLEDANGCQSSDTLVIDEPEQLLIDSISSSPNGCMAVSSGTIAVMASGGSGVYTYRWSDPNMGNTPTPNQLAAGSYELTITDANNCRDSSSIRVEQENIQLGNPDVRNNSCAGDALGGLLLSVVDAQNTLVYSLERDDGSPVSGTSIPPQISLNNLANGAYRLLVTDGRGCQDSTQFIVTSPLPIQGNAVVQPINCQHPTASIRWMGSGGQGMLQYNWSDGSTSSFTDNLAAGDYLLEVRDTAGCQITESFTIQPFTFPSLQVVAQPVSCFGLADGALFPNFTNAAAPLAYVWLDADSTEVGTGGQLRNITAGQYRLLGQDGQGCVFDEIFLLPEPEALILDVTLDDIRCAGETNGLLEINPSGGRPPYRYRLEQGPWQAENTFIGLGAGSYRVEAADQNNCSQLSESINISQPAPLQLELGDSRSVAFGDRVQLFPSISGGGGPIVSYRWTPRDSSLLSCFDCPLPFVQPIDQVNIRLQISDSRGCMAEDVVDIFVSKDFPVLVPTGFSPNGDGQNDRLLVHGRPGISILLFQVFDRWGELIFEASDFAANESSVGWDGLFRNEAAPAGIYLWQANALLPDGSRQNYRGQTTLIR